MSLQLNGTDGVTFNDGSEQWAAASPIGTKNIIINGAMQIAQRSTSTASITGTSYHTVDRWKAGVTTAGTWTQSQDTDVPTGQGFAYSVKMLCTTANASLSSNSALNLQQALEGQMLQHLKKGTANAESLTASFWVKSNKTGTYIVELYDNDNTRQISKSYTINTADTWEKKIITIAGDTTGAFDNDNLLSLYFVHWLGAGSDYQSGTLNTSWNTAVNANRVVGQVNLADSTSNYINITGVQLEVGDTATPFEHRPYDMELARCQRYYYKMEKTRTSQHISMLTALSTSNAYGGTRFPVTMRATPTGSYSSLSDLWLTRGGINTDPTVFNIFPSLNEVYFRVDGGSMTSADGLWLRFDNDAVTGSQYIAYDAEL